MIKAVIFDLDNTLIDFMRMKTLSCEAAINAMIDAGFSVSRERAMKVLFELYDRYGMEEPQIFQKFLKKTCGKIDYKILAHGIVAYRRMRTGFLEPYPHATEVLYKLRHKGLKLAILSDAPRLKAWLRLAAMRFTHIFDVVVTFEDTKKYKPDSAPFRMVLKKLGVPAGQCLMVGDRPERDMSGAKKMGMKTCFARYGNPAARAKADYEINAVGELMDVLAKERGNKYKK